MSDIIQAIGHSKWLNYFYQVASATFCLEAAWLAITIHHSYLYPSEV